MLYFESDLGVDVSVLAGVALFALESLLPELLLVLVSLEPELELDSDDLPESFPESFRA